MKKNCLDTISELGELKEEFFALQQIEMKYKLLVGIQESQYRSIIDDERVDDDTKITLLFQKLMSLEEKLRNGHKDRAAEIEKLEKAQFAKEKAQEYAKEVSSKFDKLNKEFSHLREQYDKLSAKLEVTGKKEQISR